MQFSASFIAAFAALAAASPLIESRAYKACTSDPVFTSAKCCNTIGIAAGCVNATYTPSSLSNFTLECAALGKVADCCSKFNICLPAVLNY